MSCFIVCESTLCQLARRIMEPIQYYGVGVNEYNAPRTGFLAKFKTTDALVKAMHTLNVKAYRLRYRYRDPVVPYKYELRERTSNIQAIKSLNCYLYQCDEDLISKTPLHKALTELLGLWAMHYIRATKEYEAAEYN